MLLYRAMKGRYFNLLAITAASTVEDPVEHLTDSLISLRHVFYWKGAYVIESRNRSGRRTRDHFHAIVEVIPHLPLYETKQLQAMAYGCIYPKPWPPGRPKWKVTIVHYERGWVSTYMPKNDDPLQFFEGRPYVPIGFRRKRFARSG